MGHNMRSLGILWSYFMAIIMNFSPGGVNFNTPYKYNKVASNTAGRLFRMHRTFILYQGNLIPPTSTTPFYSSSRFTIHIRIHSECRGIFNDGLIANDVKPVAKTDSISNINTIESDSADFSHMYFGTENNTVITSQTGSTAHLPCIVHNVGDGVVSWIRRKDRHLITVGFTTYNADQRYQIIHIEHSEDWTLQIRFVQRRDAGLYECQVSSHPPTSIFILLNVVEAKAQISGTPEKYIKPGSALRLQCVVLKATETPSYIFWYHNSRMINFDLDLGVNVSTDLGGRISSLVIPSTVFAHAGNYSCVPNNAYPASIYVHIFNGENPAAMQSGSSRSCPLYRADGIKMHFGL
ncbi:uncharacterized protein LOC143912392 [Arctopsyche grandis]|uniref:uncharacterized protein LOC143912392 n=1 Tax=Arctopsyche grandis TaxID=121162 RepID=UPI00406D8253